MQGVTIRTHLRRAAEEVNAARDEPLPDDVEAYLDGIEQLLVHHLEGANTEAEANIFPTPGALDTVQGRLSEIIEQIDGPAEKRLRKARAQLLQVIILLDELMTEGRPISSWR